jgi:hypothetical protein
MSFHLRRSPSLATVAMLAALAAQGCSSSSSPGGGEDAASGTDAASGQEASTGTDATGSMDAGAQSCEASTLPPEDAGGACNSCLGTKCAAELAACAADCVCGPVVACLELTNLNNYPGCPNGINAISSGEVPLMNFAACAANPAKCGGPCFSNDGGGD